MTRRSSAPDAPSSAASPGSETSRAAAPPAAEGADPTAPPPDGDTAQADATEQATAERTAVEQAAQRRVTDAARARIARALLSRMRNARAALTVIRGYTVFGALLAVAFWGASYVAYDEELPLWITRVGAMGCLLGALVGLNVMDRIMRGQPLPVGWIGTAMALVAVALLAVGVGSVRYDLGAAWAPLAAATYMIVGVRIMVRFRNQAASPTGGDATT